MLILSIVFLAVALGLCAILYRVLCRDAALTEDKENLLPFMLTLILFFSFVGGVVGSKYFADKSTTEAQKEAENDYKNCVERNIYLRIQLDLNKENRDDYARILRDSLEVLELEAKIKNFKQSE